MVSPLNSVALPAELPGCSCAEQESSMLSNITCLMTIVEIIDKIAHLLSGSTCMVSPLKRAPYRAGPPGHAAQLSMTF